MCVLLLPMVCSAWLLVVGGSGTGQQAVRPGRGMPHDCAASLFLDSDGHRSARNMLSVL